MHAAAGQQTDQVQSLAAVARVVHRPQQALVLEERALANRLVDEQRVLPHDTTGADVEVADFRVTHYAGLQADIGARSGKLRFGALAPNAVEVGRVAKLDGIAFGLVGKAPSVENAQHDGARRG
ncbi:MAG: hypothetical protein JWN98_1531, partial [Abditibacteriota bacterium]|nr:hypothetical protein [Abditibacteriota bacterium]